MFLDDFVFLFLTEDSQFAFRGSKFVKCFKWVGSGKNERPLTHLACGLREFIKSKEKQKRWCYRDAIEGNDTRTYIFAK